MTFFSFLFFSLFCVPGKFPELLTFLQSTPWWIIFEVPKGNESDHPSLTHHRHPRVCGFTTTTNRKNLRKKIVVAPQKKKKERSWKEPARPFYSFLSLELRLSPFFILCIISKIPKKSYQNGGGLWCDLRQIPSVSVQLCILCKYSHYCCLFIYKDILLHQRGSILSQENAEKLSNFRQLQWAFFCQV